MKTFLLFFSLFVLVSCERRKETEIAIPHIKKPVVYGVISPEDGAICAITISKPVTSNNEFKPITDAFVVLERNQTNYDTLLYKAPYYYSTKDIMVDGEYSLFVQFGEYEVRSEPIKINKKISILTYDYTIDLDSTVNMKMSFKDDALAINSCSAKIYLIKPDSTKYTPLKTGGPGNYSSGPIYLSPLGFYNNHYLDDGKVHFFNRQYRLKDSPFYHIEIDSIAGIKYILRSYSPSIISFYQSLNENRQIEIGSSTAPDPSWSNIIGGYGFFGAYRKDSTILLW